jgi:Tfp pilus assembly PilM family ATPase
LCERVDTSRPVAVLDWGFSRATFCIVFNGRPLFVRCLRDCEFGLLIRALRDALNLTWDEARRIAIQHAGGAQTRDFDDAELSAIVTEVIAPVVSELKAELHRTLVYLQLHRSKLVPQQLWLFGGGAAITGIAPMLEAQIEMNVRCWELGGPVYSSNCAGDIPVAMLGPAIALSCLAWEAI